MNRNLALLAAAAMACGCFSTASNATTITATWKGTVVNGTDLIGEFTPVGTDLTGLAATLSYSFDTSQGTISPFLTGNELNGNGSVTLTINAKSLTIHDNTFTSPNDAAYSGLLDNYANEVSGANQYSAEAYISDTNGLLANSILTSFSQSACAVGQFCQGSFSISNGVNSISSSLAFNSVDYVVGASVAPTPIPAAMPLFISALGGLGFVGWRRKQAGTV